MDAFKIKINGKVLDYRLGEDIELDAVKKEFGKQYEIKKLWRGGRHVLGVLEKEGRSFFLKLSTTEGISALMNVEAGWNQQFNKISPRAQSEFWVPINFTVGYFQEKLFYLITDLLDGELLSLGPDERILSPVLEESLEQIIILSEYIQQLPLKDLQREEYIEASNYQEWFLEKTRAWYRGVPEDVSRDYGVEQLLHIVERGVHSLEKRPRHGDFTPWHMMKLTNGKLALLDGEHAMSEGVEYYDIGYFIQRVFSVLDKPEFAKHILQSLLARKYNVEKLQIILAARGIGGFLDKSFIPNPDFTIDSAFKDWVLGLSTL